MVDMKNPDIGRILYLCIFANEGVGYMLPVFGVINGALYYSRRVRT
jgi:hypothetical protein